MYSFFCFKEFSNAAEMIFKGSDRRSDIDRVYSKLLQVMFDNIERISMEHDKIPPEIIMFGRPFFPSFFLLAWLYLYLTSKDLPP